MLAFVFPGQGSQKLAMLQDFYQDPILIQTFEEASEAIGLNLLTLTQEDELRLNQTEFTQPAILAASMALYRLWMKATEQQPQFLAGHSLGEYTALVVAGVFSFSDAVRLVNLRGQLMQKAVAAGEGAMAAIIGLDDRGVIEACTAAAQGQVVEAVNFNAPGQVVVAGEASAVNRAIDTAKALGAKRAILLPVSVPSHCLLMKKAAEELASYFDEVQFSPPLLKVIQNADALIHETVVEIKQALVEQLYHPVLWVKSVQNLAKLGAHTFVECGPSKVLTGLNKRILETGQFLNLDDRASFDAAKLALAANTHPVTHSKGA